MKHALAFLLFALLPAVVFAGSGDTLYVWPSQAGEFPSSGAPAQDQRNAHWVMDFDAATDECFQLSGVMPGHYAAGGTTLTIVWLASTATTGDAIFTGDWERHEDDVQDLDSDGFTGAANSVTSTAASASGEPQYAAITFTDGADMDSTATGESFRLKVCRDADNASDTMAGDAEILRVVLSET